jgi:hypothetical protein
VTEAEEGRSSCIATLAHVGGAVDRRRAPYRMTRTSRIARGVATDFAIQLSGSGWQRTDAGSQGTSAGFASPYL